MTIRKATVLGAGTMGSQIAALLVNAGLKLNYWILSLMKMIQTKSRKRLMK